MREVKSLSLLDVGLDLRPGLGLSSVGKEVHNDSSLFKSFLDGEKGLAGDLLRK